MIPKNITGWVLTGLGLLALVNAIGWFLFDAWVPLLLLLYAFDKAMKKGWSRQTIILTGLGGLLLLDPWLGWAGAMFMPAMLVFIGAALLLYPRNLE